MLFSLSFPHKHFLLPRPPGVTVRAHNSEPVRLPSLPFHVSIHPSSALEHSHSPPPFKLFKINYQTDNSHVKGYAHSIYNAKLFVAVAKSTVMFTPDTCQPCLWGGAVVTIVIVVLFQ